MKRLNNPKGFPLPHSLVITSVQLRSLKSSFLYCEPRAKQVFAVMITLIYPYTDMQLILSRLLRYLSKNLIVFGRKSQFSWLQSKVRGHSELLRSGGEGWTMEAMADRCLQRSDCDHKKGEGFNHYRPKNPLHLHCKRLVVYAPLLGKNTGLPCQPQSRWLGCISSGARVQWVLCGPPMPSTPSISCRLAPWLPLFHSLGIPQRSVFEQPALELPAARRRSCQSCYFREPGEERGKCVLCLWAREIQSFLSTSQHSWGFWSCHGVEHKHVLPSL